MTLCIKMMIFIYIAFGSKKEEDANIIDKIDVPVKYLIFPRGLKRIPIKILMKAYEQYKLTRSVNPQNGKFLKIETKESNYKYQNGLNIFVEYEKMLLRLFSKIENNRKSGLISEAYKQEKNIKKYIDISLYDKRVRIFYVVSKCRKGGESKVEVDNILIID
ncbi:hypothetical protein NGRA_2088 [Nosema granulosis]|uniref:Uncharacterized protein n=1 Tax=Nosema granulosis TaxID=83296 RepID=A0A9P6GY70_9MICR|nr:hypothetical protein NGRA_2088 [Nosema granulosis]